MPAQLPVAAIISRSKVCAVQPLRLEQLAFGVELVRAALNSILMLAIAWCSVGRGVT